MRAVFNLEDKAGFKELENLIKQMPKVAEKTINEYLHSKGKDHAIKYIKNEMPKGVKNRKTAKGQPKTHAKQSDSLKSKPFNLGFRVETTKQFNYLVFPALGIGTSYKNKPNDFMNRGLDKSVNRIIPELQEELIKKMEEKL